MTKTNNNNNFCLSWYAKNRTITNLINRDLETFGIPFAINHLSLFTGFNYNVFLKRIAFIILCMISVVKD